MFDTLKRFIGELKTRGRASGLSDDDDRLAAAALLVHLISVDGEVGKEEQDRLAAVLADRYGLTPNETAALVADAHIADEEAVDLYGFTSVLKRTLDDDGRARVIEMMWEIAYADGTVHEFEDNTVWRVAELLGISTRDRMILRKKVAEASLKSDDPDPGTTP